MANSEDAIDRAIKAAMKARPWILAAEPIPGIPNFPVPEIKLVFVDSKLRNLVQPLLSTQNAAADGVKNARPRKNPFYTPSMPTIHTGFSFSIVHFLSAIREAMISPLPEHYLEKGKLEVDANALSSDENTCSNKSNHPLQENVPSLTLQEIVSRVKFNPGDPWVLEMQEPLQDLVRGALKVFSWKRKTSGGGWDALASYKNFTKCWSWIGPITHTSTEYENIEVTSPKHWGISDNMLLNLVDSFANWLKSCQVSLQQIGSLPEPPLSLMQCSLYEKERFKGLGCQYKLNSMNTISPSSEEVREYFRKEEVLRYSFPDRAFSYTATDGKKSIVAPLKRCRSNSLSMAQYHCMLKLDRPPHVTIQSLVRDAVARLPGSIGTRADICTLIRDSQYIVEDVHDVQVNYIVSSALDHLRYQQDPCVRFDGKRRVWVYLHRDREEEDFDYFGTSKWIRTKQKKVPAEQPNQGDATVALHSTDQSGFDFGTDLKLEPLSSDENK